jgi:DNA helicase HerA-like ATPase
MKEELEIAGQVVGGDVASILIREKSGNKIELGDLLVADESDNNYLILKVFNLGYGSQISQSARELAAGLKLEGYGTGIEFMDPKLRNYTLAHVKAVARVTKGVARIPKVLPTFFSSVRYANKNDLAFLAEPPNNPVYLGKIRSGSKVLDVDVYLDGESFFTHHVLIPATTGRGKSNLVKVMLWSSLDEGKFGILVLDPHDEYYGRDGLGLKDHPSAKRNLLYYSSDATPGTNTLVINLKTLEPEHFEGIVEFTDAQEEAISTYNKEYKEDWVEKIVLGTEVKNVDRRTVKVLQRKLRTSLGVSAKDGEVVCDSEVFSTTAGESTLRDIVGALEKGKIAVIDTSRLSDEAELLIGSIIASEVFYRYREAKGKGKLKEKPTVSIIVEEAPRVLSAEKIEQGGNIYSTIAREGRKFKIGLVAITQLTSVIPRMVLTNMNTKIILGNEMATERRAIIDSAAQDLSEEDRTIASLDKGEAIVSSIFTKFAVPIYTPLFEDIVGKKDEFDFKGENLVLR